MTKPILMYDIRRMLLAKRGTRTQRQLADEIGVTEGYLSRVMNERDDPGPKVLKYLGLRKIPTDPQYKFYEDEELHDPCHSKVK